MTFTKFYNETFNNFDISHINELVPDKDNVELLEQLEQIAVEYADLAERANEPLKFCCVRTNFFGLFYRNLFHSNV